MMISPKKLIEVALPLDAINAAYEYIREQGKQGRMGQVLMAVVAEGKRGRIYLDQSPIREQLARTAKPRWKPPIEFYSKALGFSVGNYGLKHWSDLFTERQLGAPGALVYVSRGGL